MSTSKLLYAVGVTACSLLLAAVVSAQQQPSDAAGAQKPRDGEQIMNA